MALKNVQNIHQGIGLAFRLDSNEKHYASMNDDQYLVGAFSDFKGSRVENVRYLKCTHSITRKFDLKNLKSVNLSHFCYIHKDETEKIN